MKAQYLTAAVVWVLGLGIALWQVLITPPIDLVNAFRLDGFGLLAICIPLLVVPIATYANPRHPFDSRRLRERVNNRFSAGTYESYTRTVKPLLLLAVGASVMGVGLFARAFLAQAPNDAFVVGGFFLSFGLGLFAARFILRWRENTIE